MTSDWVFTKESIIRDLRLLCSLFEKHNICDDYSSIYDAVSYCEYGCGKDEWSYSCERVRFSIREKISGTIPMEAEDIFIELFVSIRGLISKLNQGCDPLDEFDLQILFNGKKLSGKEIIALIGAWHLDKHESNGALPKFTHPHYHFQYGGNVIEPYNNDLGQSLYMGAPRLPHPPMDIILATHFLVSNFYDLHSQHISNFLFDTEYLSIVKNSQLRLWKPYYLSIGSYWHEPSTSWSPQIICPLFL
jgi:hypothetical protein